MYITIHKLVQRRRQNKIEYLVRFLGYGLEHNMWEDDLGLCISLFLQITLSIGFVNRWLPGNCEQLVQQ